MPAQLSWEGDANGYRFFHLDGHFQAIRPDGQVACTCSAGKPKEIVIVPWPPGGSHCAHAQTISAIGRLGLPEGFGRDFTGEE